METRYKLSLHSNDATFIASSKVEWLRDNVVLTLVQRKLAKLHALAKYQHVYTCQILVAIDELIDHIQSAFLEEIAKFQSHLDKQGITGDKLSAKVQFEKDFGFSSRLFFGVLRTLEYFDRLVCLIVATKQAGLFEEKKAAFDLIDRQKKLMNTFLSTIIQIPLKDVPNVSIFEYIKHTRRYDNAALVFGDINPNHVIIAIKKGLVTGLPTKQADKLLKLLEEKALINV